MGRLAYTTQKNQKLKVMLIFKYPYVQTIFQYQSQMPGWLARSNYSIPVTTKNFYQNEPINTSTIIVS